MRTNILITTLAAVSTLFLFSHSTALAAADDAYNANDVLLFFQNPAGTIGTDKVAYYSLGSARTVFRDAAQDSTTFLGNINSTLASAYGADWAGASASIFAGAAGQNGATSAASTTISNGDYARTVYVTKPRSGVGTVGQANSSSPLFDPAQTSVASNISGSNNISSMTQPGVVGVTGTILDAQNPFSNGNPATAYSAIQGGIIGPIGSQFTFGTIAGNVAALDLYRVTKTTGTNAASASLWHISNNITATYSDSFTGGGARADYLGTILVGANGDVNFAAVPEPSTYALLGVAGIAAFVAYRRRQAKKA